MFPRYLCIVFSSGEGSQTVTSTDDVVRIPFAADDDVLWREVSPEDDFFVLHS